MSKGRLLLDTCAAIWLVEREPMTQAAIDAISDASYADEPILVSPISAWERGMLVSRGRLSSALEPKVWFARLLDQKEVGLADMTPEILNDASFLPEPIHRDPADRIIVETDCPYLAPVPYRGRRNEPAMLPHVLAKLAEIRGWDLKDAEQRTEDAFFALFDRIPRP